MAQDMGFGKIPGLDITMALVGIVDLPGWHGLSVTVAPKLQHVSR